MGDIELKTALHDELRWAREAMLWKLEGLSEYDVRRPLTATGTNLLGLKEASRDGRDIRLTPTEWHLLEVLAQSPGRLVGHQQLLREVWGPATSARRTTSGYTSGR